jgi:tRNA-binding protein
MRLARATVCGAGELAWPKRTEPASHSCGSTSPRPAAPRPRRWQVLMDPETGLPPLLQARREGRCRPRAGAGQVTITYADFDKVDIRVGRITRAEPFPEARKPAIKLWVDFGRRDRRETLLGADHPQHYTPETLIGRQVLAVVNFPPRQIGPVLSEVLVLGVPDAEGEVVLIGPGARGSAGRKTVLINRAQPVL